tara:strand:- start:68 stop:553 length:486 start_codon:yes stop_codon:yes gene_type:complete
MAYKQPSAGLPFKQLGSSPVKQSPTYGGVSREESLARQAAYRLNQAKTTAASTMKPTTGGSYSKPTTYGGTSKAESLSKQKVYRATKSLSKKMKKPIVNVVKGTVKKGLGVLGGKALGILGMMFGTSSKADQPTKGQGKKTSEGQQIKDLLTKHKLKGGNN